MSMERNTTQQWDGTTMPVRMDLTTSCQAKEVKHNRVNMYCMAPLIESLKIGKTN